MRSKVEFWILKRIAGVSMTRYRGLEKNANRVYARLAMINLSNRGRRLTGGVRPAQAQCGGSRRI